MRFTVSALPKDYLEADLEALFLPFGRVSFVKVYYDSMSMKSRGRGIVEMPSRADAERAMKELGGKILAHAPLSFKIEPDNPFVAPEPQKNDDWKKNFWKDELPAEKPVRKRIPFNRDK